MFHWGNRFRTVIWTTFESELNHKFSFFDDKLIRFQKIRKLRLREEKKSNETEEPKIFKWWTPTENFLLLIFLFVFLEGWNGDEYFQV